MTLKITKPTGQKLVIKKPTGQKLKFRPTWQPMDPDAATYITSVETADGQALEETVKIAIDNFVLGCKADGIWNAIKASCILAGARTLSGALVPLKGTAPTNFNFVSGDYNRKTGLVGNGSTKYLNSNRANNADPQNSNHNAAYVSVLGSSVLLGVASSISGGINTLSATTARLRSESGIAIAASAGSLTGASRSSSSSVTTRAGGASNSASNSSSSPVSDDMQIYKWASFYGSHRLAFYSIGESLDLALLDARVTALINAFSTAIP